MYQSFHEVFMLNVHIMCIGFYYIDHLNTVIYQRLLLGITYFVIFYKRKFCFNKTLQTTYKL